MIALLTLAAHMIGDYVTQNDWMAANKFVRYHTEAVVVDDDERWYTYRQVADNFWHAAFARTVHVLIYTLGFIAVAWAARLSLHAGLLYLGLVFATHWLTDCRRWAKGDKWPPKPILVDQAIHITTLSVLAAAFGMK